MFLKKNAVLNFVLPDNSDDYELEEEEYEVVWLLKEDSSVSSSKDAFYCEAGRAARVSERPLYPQLVWPSRDQNNNSKYAEYENIL